MSTNNFGAAVGGFFSKIKKKLKSQIFTVKLLCIGSAAILAFVFAGVAVIYGSLSSYATSTSTKTKTTDSINSLTLTVYETVEKARAYVASPIENNYKSYTETVSGINAASVSVLVLELSPTNEQKALCDEFIASVDSLISTAQESVALAKEGSTALATMKINKSDAFSQTLSSLAEKANALNASLSQTLNAQINSDQTTVLIVVIVVAALVVCVCGVFVVLIVYTSKAIFRPINLIREELRLFSEGIYTHPFELTEDESDIGLVVASIKETKKLLCKMVDELSWILDQIAHGNVSFRIALAYKGEFNSIKIALDTILNENNREFTRIRESSDAVSSASTQLSSSSSSLSDGALDQSKAIELLSDSVDDITQKSTQNAQNAKTASDYSAETFRALDAGNAAMQKMLGAMDEIKQTSDRIEKIIKTIEDIAFQTNILALNAAVEAARAGDAGKGFAVVADEVRNLAGKSAEAANSTAALIRASIDAVNQGAEHAGRTADAMKGILEASRKTDEIVELIATSALEEKNAIAQISEAVEQISGVVQTNSALAQESAAAADELSQQADTLRILMERYQLREE